MAKQPTGYVDPWTEEQACSCNFPVWIEGHEIWSIDQYKKLIAEKTKAPALELDKAKK